RASKLSLAHLHELSHNGLPSAGLSAVSLTVPVAFLELLLLALCNAMVISLYKGQREGAQLIKESICPH
ncbi:MAG: hypothetical protein J6B18_02070, partial [Bacteroidaceae bacterium]|nr:hypothetical protein [Bacteroidaceae bacterium]